MLTDDELDLLEARCRQIPLSPDDHFAEDLLAELFDTVLDYQNRAATVRKALAHFRTEHGAAVTTLDDLEAVLADHPDDEDLAAFLWGNRHWRRARELRGLVAYLRERDVTDLAALRRWAASSTQAEFVGHIKGLGPAVYRSLVMRLGVDTIKPDVHVLRFASAAVGRRVTQDEAVASLEEVARRIGTSARTLDGSIWAYQVRGSGTATETMNEITTTTSVRIDAAIDDVWKAITTPSTIEQWFFGVRTETDWQPGNPIVHVGEWQGKPYQDEGTILQIEPPRLLVHTHWSQMSGLPDEPANHEEVRWELAERDGSTELTLRERNLASEKAKAVSEQAWATALGNLKRLLES